VALAVQAARAALLTGPAQPRPAVWARTIRVGMPAADLAGERTTRGADTGLSPDLIRATARAARASGRQPTEVWSEALSDWLAGRDAQRDAVDERPLLSLVNARRTQTWQAIEATLGDLRAS
jgi:hypothetical protein